MDIYEWLFPFIMAVLSSSVLIIIMFFLRKSKFFANMISVGLIGALYLFCILRMIIPIEFPDLHLIIRDTHLYTGAIDFLIGKDETGTLAAFSLLHILLIVWAVVSLALLIRMIVKQNSYQKYIEANAHLETDDEKALLWSTAKEVFGKETKVTLKRTDAVSESMVIGFVHPTVLIPDIAYTQAELEMIFRHECMHIRDKDIWIKLLIELYCIIFWWNPFSYLMKVDISDTLETKCDLNVIRRFDNVDKLKYAETVAKFMSIEKDKRIPFVNARFSKARNNKEAVKRIAAILQTPPKKTGQIILNLVSVVLIIGIFFGSYMIIFQSYSEPSEEDYEIIGEGRAIVETDCYLVKQDDGNYLLYISGFSPEVIPKEEVEKGYYNDYPIYEE